MSNMQLWLTVGIPTGTVLLGILLNQFGINILSGRMQSIESRLLIIEGDLRRFYQIIGEHGGKLEILEKKP